MEISCFTTGIVNVKHPGQGIMDLVNAGFDQIVLDMGMYCAGSDLENFGCAETVRKKPGTPGRMSVMENPSNLSRCLEPLLNKVKDGQLRITTAYAPVLLRNTKRTDLNDLLQNIVEESIRLCGTIGCRYLVVRPLFAGAAPEDMWQVNREFYLDLAAAAKEADVMILLENQCRDVGGHLVRGLFADGSTAAEWIDRLNEACGEERFGFCMDVGVCNLCGQNMYEFACALKERIKLVILRDCDGHHESAMIPFTSVFQRKSRTDWLSLIRGLRAIGFDGRLALEITDTAAAFSPILRPQMLSLAKATGDYFKWQIEIENQLKSFKSIVLFGAGNMCRNYMKCYGEKYLPLFTCDNNRALWGTSFCGLEVKPPQALKEIPADCGIFICNIYYREIEKQLREMEILNPITFFNDEYMPSFYFNRLEQ